MELIIKAGVAGVAAALIALVIKKSNPESSLMLTLAAAAAIITAAMGLFTGVKEILTLAESVSGLPPAVLSPVLKCVAIGIVSRLCADICSDSGSAAVASAVELAGSAAALYVALPLLRTLITMIGQLA